MRQRKPQVLADHNFIAGFERRLVQNAGDPGNVIVRQQSGGVLIQESGGDEYLELLAPIELQNLTDAVQHLAADAPLAGFEPAQGAPVDLGQVSDLLLSHTALASEPRQDPS